MKSFFELLQEELDAMYTKPENIYKSIHEEIERLKAEIKRSNELAEYRLQLLMQMPENKPWVELTDEEVDEILDDVIGFNSCFGPETAFARAIEAKVKEKNHG
jgi:transcription antitermination factor NusA-like protein